MKQKAEYKVTLELDGPKITSDKFVRAVNAFFGMVNDVSKQVSGKNSALSWVVSVESGSARINAMPEPTELSDWDTIPPILKAIEESTTSIESGSDIPRYFSDHGLERMRDLASIKDDGVSSIRLIVDNTTVNISHYTTAHVDDILGEKSKALGTIEGKLQMITERGGFKFAIYDDLTDKRVECHVSPEKFEDIKNAFGKRVSVYGIVNYRESGIPNSVKVQEFRVLSKKNLPTFEDMKGILKDA